MAQMDMLPEAEGKQVLMNATGAQARELDF
jgi:hypothetical protein